MRTIKIHLDDRMHSQKPDKKDTALISQRITEKETEIGIAAFDRVGGYPLVEQPTSHTTVRTVRYTAVQ